MDIKPIRSAADCETALKTADILVQSYAQIDEVAD